MVRFVFSLIISVMVARWLYAEAMLVWPSSIPFLDRAVHLLTIPTHDRWNRRYFDCLRSPRSEECQAPRHREQP
jgi:hypothetical protein